MTMTPDDDPLAAAPLAGDLAMTLAEEVARITTRDVITGRVRVSTTVEPFEEIARAALQTETVEVTRVPVGHTIDTPPAIRTEGDVTIIPVVEEVLVLVKRLILKEELHVRKTVTTRTVEEPVTLRRQRALIERFDRHGATIDESSR